MAGPYDLTGQNIEDTYQRILQTPDGSTFYDGTGSAVIITATAVAGGSNTQIQFNSASLLSGSSNFSFDYVNNNILLTGSLLVTQSHISTVDYIDFNQTATPAFLTGRLHWTDDTKTLQIDTDVNGFEIELGHQNVVRGRNITGYTLTKGMIVYINGESGNRPTFTTASWEGDPSSASTLGFVAQDINDSQTGYVVTNGILRGINTNAFPPGTQLYLSSSGQYTSTVPISPNHEVRLGKTITQATDGYIYVDIMNGYELGELHDVLIVSRSNGDLISWDSGSRVWINTKVLSGSYSLSGSLTTNDGVSVQSLTASFVSASSITGSLLGTASYSNQTLSSSYSDTASYVNPLNQIVQITGSLLVSNSIDSNNRYLINSDTLLSIDWENRQLYNSVGATLDWSQMSLIDSSNNTLSANWNTRIQYDAGGESSVLWNDRQLHTLGAISVLNWGLQELNDPGGNTSINWGGRQLYGTAGDIVFQWDTVATSETILQEAYKFTRLTITKQENFIITNNNLTDLSVSVEGEIIGVDSNIDGAVALGDLVSLGEDGIWYQTDQASISGSAMLGICVNPISRGFILIEGTIGAVTGSGYTDVPFVEGTSFYGKPVYMRPGVLGGLTTTKPTSGYVRVVGHMYYNSTTNPDYWLLKFRPSNDWYEI